MSLGSVRKARSSVAWTGSLEDSRWARARGFCDREGGKGTCAWLREEGTPRPFAAGPEKVAVIGRMGRKENGGVLLLRRADMWRCCSGLRGGRLCGALLDEYDFAAAGDHCNVIGRAS